MANLSGGSRKVTGGGVEILQYSDKAKRAERVAAWGPGAPGVLRFKFDRGVPLEPHNPYPSLRVILAEKVTRF